MTVGHPAHMHYFKNATRMLQEKGHKVLFFVRDRECIIENIKKEGFDYVCYGKGGEGLFGKFLNIFSTDYSLLKVALKFKPDIFVSMSSHYAGHVSRILMKPHITITDTEYAKLANAITFPVSDTILSPYVWYEKKHSRQIFFKSFLENLYLSDKYFKPDESILKDLGIDINEKYCVVRFVALNANHDVGVKKMSYDDKLDIIRELTKHYKVFITSEHELPAEIEPLRLSLHPSQFHSVVNFASLCVSEGITTASEAAVLGVPTILTNPLRVGYCDEEERKGLLHKAFEKDEIIEKIRELANIKDIKNVYHRIQQELTTEMIDGTQFLVWFIENYPESKKIMKENPDYQNRFK